MSLIHRNITQVLENFRLLSCSDFSALAITRSTEHCYRWTYAVGCRSEKYRQMTLKPGSGPAGLALRIGKVINWDDRSPPITGFRKECPLMMAEQLRCAAAFPLTMGEQIQAILLVARRSPLPYESSDIHAIQDELDSISLTNEFE
ncbi:GAF domain-containing protein [Cohnella sp. WQ 127256]|uniref:GAF domain-containing protein n=1 Tax=Cohnella sp. WQ 127256 TaxID=2938790 RepID=UPI002118F275|nr:GAF domain-containing protein [Cohnella sp. WQ 127256]